LESIDEEDGMSDIVATRQAPVARPVNVALWVLQALLALQFAAGGLAALMVGATVTNLFVIHERPWLPVGLLLVAAVIAWGRR
jgi:hypothetical protein